MGPRWRSMVASTTPQGTLYWDGEYQDIGNRDPSGTCHGGTRLYKLYGHPWPGRVERFTQMAKGAGGDKLELGDMEGQVDARWDKQFEVNGSRVNDAFNLWNRQVSFLVLALGKQEFCSSQPCMRCTQQSGRELPKPLSKLCSTDCGLEKVGIGTPGRPQRETFQWWTSWGCCPPKSGTDNLAMHSFLLWYTATRE